MEIYYITFAMNSGKSVEIEEKQEEGYDFLAVLRNSNNKWYKKGNQIVNLEKVNNIKIETKTERDAKYNRS